MRKMKKICFTLMSALLLVSSTLTAKASMPYDSYNFNYYGEEVLQPHTYLYTDSLTSAEFGTSLKYPSDMVIKNEMIYIADTGNSRILVTDMTGKVVEEIKSADGKDDVLNGPQGLFVTDEGHIYVADSNNGRIVEYDEEFKYLRTIGRPVTTLVSDRVIYTPTKIVVDNANRIYVIAYGINMGLLEFNYDGEFQGFMGAAEVSVSKFTYIWKNYFATEAQQIRMDTIVPTEYSNIYVDDENFIYATINNLDEDDFMEKADAIRRLNPTGVDVLRRLGNYEIIGDLNGRETHSSFCDVISTDYGCYFVLDDSLGKVFAYDYDGNSLFVFGKKGTKDGNVQKPSAIAFGKDESEIYILDNILGSVMKYEITEYGQHLLDALYLDDIGDAEGANAEWMEVLKYNSNNEMAYIGLGKTFLTEGNYKQAMEYFKLGNSRKYYSKAFYYYRMELMENNFSKIMLAIGGLIVLVIVIKAIFKFRRWVGDVKCFMLNR